MNRQGATYPLQFFDKDTKEIITQDIVISFISMQHMKQAEQIRLALVETIDLSNEISELHSKIATAKALKEKGWEGFVNRYKGEIEKIKDKLMEKENIPSLRIELILDILEKNFAMEKILSKIDDRFLSKEFWESNVDWDIHNSFIFAVINKDFTDKKSSSRVTFHEGKLVALIMKKFGITEKDYYEKLDIPALQNMIAITEFTKEEHEQIWEVKRVLGEVY